MDEMFERIESYKKYNIKFIENVFNKIKNVQKLEKKL